LKIDFEHTFKPVYIYDIIDLNEVNTNKEIINNVSTPMCKIKVLPSEFVSNSSVALSKQCIDQKYLNKK
jgi:hypothetical protein